MTHDAKIQVRFPRKLKLRVRAEARRRLMSDSDIIRVALSEYFQRTAAELKKEAA